MGGSGRLGRQPWRGRDRHLLTVRRATVTFSLKTGRISKVGLKISLCYVRLEYRYNLTAGKCCSNKLFMPSFQGNTAIEGRLQILGLAPHYGRGERGAGP